MRFQHTYADALPNMVRPGRGEEQPAPQLVALNTPLCAELGLDPDFFASQAGLGFLLGHDEAHALAYSGHQFGQFSPILGDGRALLLGDEDGYEFHAKGTGRTAFSRPGSDGRAALGPMLREYIISESLHALGIPTTRCLAVITTGRKIQRQRVVPAAVMVRVARSHLRVGTVQYAAMTGQVAQVIDFAREQLYPCTSNEELFRAVMAKQVDTVARWQKHGFIHGVMNTDNTTLSGESIDFGPCAFMERYDPDTVFSSIDTQGRYRFGNQPRILGWNLARLAEALLALFDENPDTALNLAQHAMDGLDLLMDDALRRHDAVEVEGDITLANHERDNSNPITIARNQPVENALKAAEDGDLGHFNELLAAVRHPHDYHPELSTPSDNEDFITYCGT